MIVFLPSPRLGLAQLEREQRRSGRILAKEQYL